MTGAGSAFTAPAAPTTKKFDTDCGSLVDAGYTINECVQSKSPGGNIAAFVEVGNSSTVERALVYRQVGNTWSLVERDVPGKGAPTIYVTKADLNDDGDSKAVFTVPSGNQSFVKTLDVIDTSGAVVMHLNLNGGFAKAAAGGGLEAWYPSAENGYDHDLIRYLGGRWTVDSQDHQSQTQAQANEPSGGQGGTGFTP